MSLFGFIWSSICKQRFLFSFMMLLSFTWTFEMLYWPYYLGHLVDILHRFDLDRVAAWSTLHSFLLWGALLWIFMDGAFRCRDFMSAKAFPRLEAGIRMDMFDHVQRHSPRYFNEHFSGKLASKIGDLVMTTTTLIRDTMMCFIPAIFTSIVSIIIFSRINALFGLILIVWIVLHFGFCWFFTKKCAHYAYIHGDSRSTISGKIVDSLTNNFIVNLFYRFKFEKEHIGRYQVDERQKNERSHFFSALMFASLSLVLAFEVILLGGFAISYWMKGAISTGEVVQLFYSIWNLIMVLWFVADKAPEFFQSLGIAKQAFNMMNDPQDILDQSHALPLQVKQGKIEFDQVTFGYGDNKIFQNKCLTIHPGEKVGLVGYSGSGKSTFVNLILRFFTVEKGRILIDDQDIAEVTLESLRNQVALIPQDPILFHRTLEENIRYGKIDALLEEVVEAAKLAHCDGFIQKTSNGYHTLVGERGTKLSGGEKQRIAIARALLVKAPILILDEATSALDSVTEQYIQESLTELIQRGTTIVVAHRLSTLSKMDRILVFDNGRIIEEGSHTQLLQLNKHYAHMWKMQAGGFLPDQPE